jgi:CheY-like chemotaxis protein
VVLAENGRVAVERFAESPEGFDAVLMDCQMPVMDGYDATRSIRAMEDENLAQRVPIIALTAAAVAGERERCLDAGMDDFLTKPVDVGLLRTTMRRWAPSSGSAGEPDEGASRAFGVPDVDPGVLDAGRLEELLDLDPGDPTMLLRFIGRFGTNARATVAQMFEARREGTAYELGRLAHGLKGSAANLGAHRLALLCREVEYLGDDGTVADEAALERLAEAVDEAAGALERFAESVGAATSR